MSIIVREPNLCDLGHGMQMMSAPLSHFCTPYNFVKYWPIFKYFSLSESGDNL